MKKLQLILITLLAFITQVSAQQLISPADFFAIMDSSEIMYEVRTDLDQYIEPIDYSENINTGMVYREEQEDAFSVKEFNIPLMAKEAFIRAEQLFNDNKPEEAREMYELTLKEAPSFSRAYTYIGQTYYMQKDYKKAVKYLKKSIKLNSIDFMSYWFLADSYYELGQKQKALDNILIAKVLNRNNSRIQASLKRILAINHLRYEEWQFNPQIKLDSIGEKHVLIASKPEWLPYAMVEAAYTFDPAFVNIKNDFPLNRTKEGVLALSLTLNEEKTVEKHPEFIALTQALEHKNFNDYIYYELLLLKYPKLAYYLTEKGRNGIINYVKETRLKKIE